MQTIQATADIVDDLGVTRRRLRFRAWHRGTREMDLLVGRFADTVVPALDPAGLKEFESLLACEDPDLWDYVTGKQPVPDAVRSGVMEKFLGFSGTGLV